MELCAEIPHFFKCLSCGYILIFSKKRILNKFGTGFVLLLPENQKLNFYIRNNLNKTLAQDGEFVKNTCYVPSLNGKNLYITQFSSSRFVMNREDFFILKKS